MTIVDNGVPLRKICFTGVRGVGKSTLLREIDKGDLDMCFTSGSGILQEMMGDEYSHFEYLPEYKKYVYRLRVRDTLQKIQEQHGKDLLVDSHLTVYNLKTGNIDLIFTHMDYGFYTDIILLDSTPERVYTYRVRDTSKKRIIDKELIHKELEFEKQEAMRISAECGLRLHIIEMNNTATENMMSILRG
ncbi:hypothetical protein EO95_02820 [Methanosarcina sp. 1.H.T.1A.1]|uniref:AAA family ATPase n=1 Tax=Methanosarcina sp. 1.H.T.1A.1 TaxID=1483602 RepID=UPI0006215D52|nr:AAA family ATPase [Methanosarcina sp. 1.H.T.1A.1]KKH92339.1 hypothetical protein EO95_02820 [Methanosarcina sp. 1.H.T.1A.1]